jgi:predicted PurR-regulated permease PerM
MLIIAALMAFVLSPVVSFLQHRLKFPRVAAVLTAYLLLLLLVLLAPLLFLPPIIDGYNAIASVDFQSLANSILTWLRDYLLYLKTVQFDFFGVPLDFSGIADSALQRLQGAEETPVALPSFATLYESLSSAATITFGWATSVVGTVFSGALTVVFTLFYAIYISLDSHKFGPWFLAIVPRPYRPEVAILLSRLRRIWRAYFRGQLTLMVIIGVIITLGNLALGMRGAFALGVVAGLLEVLPGLGPFIAAVPAVLLALIQGSSYLPVSNLIFALIIIGFYWGVQQIENNFIVPRVLGEAVELHPLVIMVGLVVGASVGGILGALLAAPVIASTREILSYLYAKILNEDPFPPVSEPIPRLAASWPNFLRLFNPNKGQPPSAQAGQVSHTQESTEGMAEQKPS